MKNVVLPFTISFTSVVIAEGRIPPQTIRLEVDS
jgi:hypothetical protein